MSPVNRVKESVSNTAASQPCRRTVFMLAGCLAVAAGLAYSNTFDVPFLFDDQLRIEDNVLIRQLWPISIPMENSNRPFGMATFAINYALHGNQVWGYHVTNLAIHILAGLTLFGIVRRTLSRNEFADKLQFSATTLAFAIALIWLVHPLNTQAVTYIVQRLESLMGLCYLATLYSFIRGQNSTRRALWHAASIACCAFGMGIKEVMVTAPVMVVWYHRAFVANSWREVFRDYGRYYGGLFSTWGILAWCMLRTQSEYADGNIAFVKGLTPLSYLLSQAGVITHYLWLSIWPFGQCLDYGWPVADSPGEIIPPLLFIAGLVAASVWAVFRYPAWGFLGGWFFVILGPTSSFVPIIDLAFEQRMYLPLAAVVAVFVFALDAAVGCVARRRLLSRQRLRLAGACLIAVLALQMSVLTWGRNEVYRSEIGIWEDTIFKAPQNARGHHNLGNALQTQGDLDLAIEQFQNAIRLRPEFAEAYNGLGNAMQEKGEIDAAIEHCRHAIYLKPDYAEAYSSLGNAMQAQGTFDRAAEYFRQAIRLKPQFAEAYNNLGNSLQSQGKFDAAVECYRHAIVLKPDYADAYSNLASVLLDQRKYELAEDLCRAAIRLKPDFVAAYNNLGNALQGQGKFESAVEQYGQAIRLKPDFAAAYHNRSVVQFKLRNYDRAWDDLKVCRQLGMTPNSEHLDALIAASGRSE